MGDNKEWAEKVHDARVNRNQEARDAWAEGEKKRQEERNKRAEEWTKGEEKRQQDRNEAADEWAANERERQQDRNEAADKWAANERERQQERNDRQTIRNIQDLDTLEDKVKELHKWENIKLESALRYAKNHAMHCHCHKWKRQTFECTKPKPENKRCKEQEVRDTLAEEAEATLSKFQEAFESLIDDMNDADDESKKEEIYQKACDKDLEGLGRLGFLCKDYKSSFSHKSRNA